MENGSWEKKISEGADEETLKDLAKLKTECMMLTNKQRLIEIGRVKAMIEQNNEHYKHIKTYLCFLNLRLEILEGINKGKNK